MSSSETQESIDAVVREPKAWLYEANRLKRAADIIGTQFQGEALAFARLESVDSSQTEIEAYGFGLAPAYLMLAGYAVENLAKALIVARDQSQNSLNWVTKNHLSVEMLERAGVALVDGEPDLVDRLDHRIRWAGKYPAPNLHDARRFAASVKARGWWGNPTRASTNDVLMVDELFGRMVALLESDDDDVGREGSTDSSGTA